MCEGREVIKLENRRKSGYLSGNFQIWKRKKKVKIFVHLLKGGQNFPILFSRFRIEYLIRYFNNILIASLPKACLNWMEHNSCPTGDALHFLITKFLENYKMWQNTYKHRILPYDFIANQIVGRVEQSAQASTKDIRKM